MLCRVCHRSCRTALKMKTELVILRLSRLHFSFSIFFTRRPPFRDFIKPFQTCRPIQTYMQTVQIDTVCHSVYILADFPSCNNGCVQIKKKCNSPHQKVRGERVNHCIWCLVHHSAGLILFSLVHVPLSLVSYLAIPICAEAGTEGSMQPFKYGQPQ